MNITRTESAHWSWLMPKTDITWLICLVRLPAVSTYKLTLLWSERVSPHWHKILDCASKGPTVPQVPQQLVLISFYKADNPQIRPEVGYDYILPGPRLPSQLQSATAIDQSQFMLLGEQRHVCEGLARVPGWLRSGQDWTDVLWFTNPLDHYYCNTDSNIVKISETGD